ncbi:OadG family protein [Congregibacter sp.]|uniref:OadG family protein n=1 Tax=Congregibacter sp. TaxID=2744308 RepID=UPI003F6D7385
MGSHLLSQGIELMMYGMGTVVVFLTLLVFASRLMSLIIQRFFPEPPVVVPQRVSTAAGELAPTPEVLAAISAAVHQHRRRRVSVSDLEQRNSHG